MKFTRPQFLSTLWNSLFFVLLVSLVCPLQGRAQQNTGSFSGTVKDQAGAVLPQAIVTATNISTGSVDRTSQMPLGYIPFPVFLSGLTRSRQRTRDFPRPPSRSHFAGVSKGRCRYRHAGRPDGQTVTVQAATPLVDPSTASLGTVVDQQAIEELPLNLRKSARWR